MKANAKSKAKAEAKVILATALEKGTKIPKSFEQKNIVFVIFQNNLRNKEHNSPENEKI